MLLDRLEDIEHARFRALAQIILVSGSEKQDAGIEAFEDYMKIAFPSLEQRKETKKQQARNALMSWIKEGPLKVTALSQPGRANSRLKSRVVARMMKREQSDVHANVVKKWKQRREM